MLNESIERQRCGETVKPKREAQTYSRTEPKRFRSIVRSRCFTPRVAAILRVNCCKKMGVAASGVGGAVDGGAMTLPAGRAPDAGGFGLAPGSFKATAARCVCAAPTKPETLKAIRKTLEGLGSNSSTASGRG